MKIEEKDGIKEGDEIERGNKKMKIEEEDGIKEGNEIERRNKEGVE